MANAGLTFLSWVRTGLISKVGAPPGAAGNLLDAVLPASATLPVKLTLAEGGAVSFEAGVVGPGDVIGLDSRQVIRCDPAPGAKDVEPNYFPIIEFDRPELPWMLTPNVPAEDLPGPGARRGLRPWLCLIVVEDCALDPPTMSRPLPRLTALDSELPDLETAWLWAHAQVLTAAGEEVKELLARNPERTLSRLVAPRRLRAGRHYLACVVPTFDAGRRAGLGLEPMSGASLGPAWSHGPVAQSVQLPVYYSWRFSTNNARGDFEVLARRLRGTRFGNAGVRPLDVGHAGSGLPGPETGAAPWEIDLEGAIIGGEIVPGTWNGSEKAELQAAIALRLAASEQELAPPTYGGLQARHPGAITGGQGPKWLRELNLDPRYRVTASIGAKVVQRRQEALMASAWEQTAETREANRLLRQAQLARAVGETIEKRISAAAQIPADRLLQITGKIHNQTASRTAAGTVAAALSRNSAVGSSVSLAFRRLARPKGPLAKRLTAKPLAAPVLRLGFRADQPGVLRPTPKLTKVSGATSLQQISETESFEGLTAARMVQPVFPWEPSAPMPSFPGVVPSLFFSSTGTPTSTPGSVSPRHVPFGYLSDMIVLTSARSEYDWQQLQFSAAIARSLDFDGAPQLGWESVQGFPVEFVGAKDLSAFTYVEREDHLGFLALRLSTWYANRNVFSGMLTWHPGMFLEPAGSSPPGAQTPVSGELPRGLAIAATDLAGNGRIDVVVIWSDHSDQSVGPYMTAPATVTRIAVGRDFDPESGGFRQGWTTPRAIFDGGGPYSAAAVGSQVFVLHGSKLHVETLASDGSVTQSAAVDIRHQLAEDFVSGAIVTADFGGGTGADLLIFFVAGPEQDLRAAYRIAYDVKADGSVGGWGDTLGAPIAVAGREIRLLLGATSTTAQRRTQMTADFRAAAEETQARQQRLLLQAAAPAPAADVDATALAEEIRVAIDARVSVTQSVTARLSLAAQIDLLVIGDPLQPLALTPRFPYAMFEIFRDDFQERLFPGASRLPDDSVTALCANRKMIESFMVGLNHEMSRELLWRGFPVRHGTYFRHFWDAAHEEIRPIESWSPNRELGKKEPEDAAGVALLLLVRAELVRRIPNVTIYAAPAIPGSSGTGRTVDLTRRRAPIFSSRLEPDIRCFGFDLTAEDARGVSDTDGWYFVFQEHPTAPRFGLDESTGSFGTRPATWANVEWSQVVSTEDEYERLAYVNAGSTSPLADALLADGGSSTQSHCWGFSAAHMAHITLQRPVQVAIHASDLIDNEAQS